MVNPMLSYNCPKEIAKKRKEVTDGQAKEKARCRLGHGDSNSDGGLDRRAHPDTDRTSVQDQVRDETRGAKALLTQKNNMLADRCKETC